MSGRKPRLGGWSSPAAADRGWRSRRDWIGWHTILAGLLGAALPLAIGILTGAFGVGREIGDISHDPVALQEHYAVEWNEAFELERELAYIGRLNELAYADQVSDDPAGWAVGFRAGWIVGRSGALAAMRQSAVAQDLGEYRPEWVVLDNPP